MYTLVDILASDIVKPGLPVHALTASSGAVWCILQKFFMAVQVSICVSNIMQHIIWVRLESTM